MQGGKALNGNDYFALMNENHVDGGVLCTENQLVR